ncbi:dehydrogenase [Aspergillus oryzae 100-8]|uniref:Dehydrogenase with different specificitie n=1 Tax=Aspergillus oryzae (strain 3.042) TaxID=1160506 RepID=I8A9Z1_ASPO3|nr:dehydrogenase with different specificitie [Aspergillus oryzae 3.042]KDE80910.1 dehydrogenase [Aspergillus oryzae 100-8]|eukprot:EIT81774.1 dehydrogenase with different specificitie [Aspergillus oryzae 3.042]
MVRASAIGKVLCSCNSDIPNLRGKVAVVTGGNSGIGLATIRLLCLREATVYFTTRTETKAHETLEYLRINYPDIKRENIRWLLLDLSDLQSVVAAVEELKRKENKVDILSICNLIDGASWPWMGIPYGYKVCIPLVANDTHTETFSYVGPFVFVNKILPLLKNALGAEDADARIITLSSTAHRDMLPPYPWQWRYFGKFIFGFDMIRYAVSKAANALFAQELQRRLDKQGLPITSIAVHPGEVATEGLMSSNTAPVRMVARLLFLTADEGAVTPLFAATAVEVRQDPERYKGRFLVPIGRVEAPNPVANDDEQVKGLWGTTVKEVNKHLADNGLPPLEPW